MLNYQRVDFLLPLISTDCHNGMGQNLHVPNGQWAPKKVLRIDQKKTKWKNQKLGLKYRNWNLVGSLLGYSIPPNCNFQREMIRPTLGYIINTLPSRPWYWPPAEVPEVPAWEIPVFHGYHLWIDAEMGIFTLLYQVGIIHLPRLGWKPSMNHHRGGT
jgi:hypothetical protein